MTNGPTRRRYSYSGPHRSAEEIMDYYGFNKWLREVASRAAHAVATYRDWYLSELGAKEEYDGETADDVVDRLLPDRSLVVRKRVLDAALVIAMEDGADLTCYQRNRIREERRSA